MLPSELPPPFETNDLASSRAALQHEWSSIPTRRNQPWFYSFTTKPEIISFPRHQRNDRRLSIVNPISYFFLSEIIADNWVTIRRYLNKSTWSLSKPVFDWDGERTFIRPDFAKFNEARARKSVDFPYVFNVDISRYYHSIYTHTIPWALHGRAVAKKDRSNSLLGNRIDALVRACQDGQTVGIAVGPDTSRIIAEIVNVGIDTLIGKRERSLKVSISRFVDDMFAGTSSAYEAERQINSIRRVINSFELDLNESKTRIERVALIAYASWRHKIHLAIPRARDRRANFEVFFDLIVELAAAHPDDNVALYSLKRAREVLVNTTEWVLIEDFLLVFYRNNPSCLSTIIEIFAYRNVGKGGLDKDKLISFVAASIKRLSDNDKFGEIAWLLFLCKAVRLPLRASVVRSLSAAESSVCALLLCDLEQMGLLSGPLDKTVWNMSLVADGLRSEMWLYAYEASLKGWSGQPSSFVNSSPEFGPLFREQVSFYNEKRNLKTLASLKRRSLSSAAKTARAFAGELEEVELTEEDLSISFVSEPFEVDDLYS